MTHVISGCGPGIPRPAKTPCEGTRSVRKSREVIEAELENQLYRLSGMLHAGQSQYSFGEWARELQRGADLARKMMG